MTLKDLKSLKKGKVILYGQHHYKIVSVVVGEFVQDKENKHKGVVQVRDLVQLMGNRNLFNKGEIMSISVHDILFEEYTNPEKDVVKYFAEYMI